MEVSYRDIPGFVGYRVGDDGSVWSCRSRGSGPLGEEWRRITGGISCGYIRVLLRIGGGRISKLVHRLVLEAFAGPCPGGNEACHGNGIRTDNRLENLRWDTRRSNSQDRTLHGTAFHAKGILHGRRKIGEAEALEIIRSYRCGESLQAELARKFGITKQQVSRIVRGERWSHLQNQGA